MRVLVVLLLVAPTLLAERVAFKTRDGAEIVGTWHPAGKDAPTVICLPMYRNKKESYKPLVGPLVLAGKNVLAIDLRGHGDSTPELQVSVNNRDAKLFNKMHLDVAAAIDFLESKKACDRTRISLVGASVGCSVALDYTRRHPGDIRSVVLLTPGPKYLGVDSIEHLKAWAGTDVLTLVSKEERPTSQAVIDALDAFDGSSSVILPGKGIHGTRMFGKVNGIADIIVRALPSDSVRIDKKITLQRAGKAFVDITPKGLTVRLPEGMRGSATIAVGKKKKMLRMKKDEPGVFERAWERGDRVFIEVRDAKEIGRASCRERV